MFYVHEMLGLVWLHIKSHSLSVFLEMFYYVPLAEIRPKLPQLSMLFPNWYNRIQQLQVTLQVCKRMHLLYVYINRSGPSSKAGKAGKAGMRWSEREYIDAQKTAEKKSPLSQSKLPNSCTYYGISIFSVQFFFLGTLAHRLLSMFTSQIGNNDNDDDRPKYQTWHAWLPTHWLHTGVCIHQTTGRQGDIARTVVLQFLRGSSYTTLAHAQPIYAPSARSSGSSQ